MIWTNNYCTAKSHWLLVLLLLPCCDATLTVLLVIYRRNNTFNFNEFVEIAAREYPTRLDRFTWLRLLNQVSLAEPTYGGGVVGVEWKEKMLSASPLSSSKATKATKSFAITITDGFVLADSAVALIMVGKGSSRAVEWNKVVEWVFLFLVMIPCPRSNKIGRQGDRQQLTPPWRFRSTCSTEVDRNHGSRSRISIRSSADLHFPPLRGEKTHEAWLVNGVAGGSDLKKKKWNRGNTLILK